MHRFYVLAPLLILLTHCQPKKAQEEFSFSKPAAQKELTKVSQSVTLNNKGIGPISELVLTEIDTAMVQQGRDIYESKCTACHRIGETFIGPPPNGVLQRRSPEWVMNLLLNTEEMLQRDSTAKGLFMEFNGQLMTNQQLTKEEARAILEYFRTL